MDQMKEMTTNEMFQLIENKPLTLFKTAHSHGLEVYEYLGRAVRDPDGQSVGPRSVHPFAKVLAREGLPKRSAGGKKAAMVGDYLLDGTHPGPKRSYYRLLFHEAMRKDVEDTLNAYSAAPIDISKLTDTMDPSVQKITGGFSVSDHLRDGMNRPAIRRADQLKEQPRLVVELQDIAMAQVDMPFGGEKALQINNDPERFPTPRFAEYEEIPRARFGYEEMADQIYKYGIGIEASYEFIQNAQNIGFDQLSFFFSQLATYWRIHEVNEGIDTMLQIFADGGQSNPGTKASTPVGSDDPLSGTNVHLGSKEKRAANQYCLDPHSWRNMWKNFEGYVPFHFRLNHILGRAHYTTEIELLNMGRNNISNPSVVGPPETTSTVNPLPALRTADGHPYGWTDRLPAEAADGKGYYLAYDRNWSLLYFVRMQSNIQETERFILNQSQIWVISKAYGFRIFDKDALQLIAVYLRPEKTLP